MTDLALGVDIGGTNLRVGAIDGRGVVVQRRDRPTPAGAGVPPEVAGPELVRAIAETARRVVDDLGLGDDVAVPIGIGFAGGITRDGEAVYGSNVATRNFPLRADVAAALEHDDVVVVNDANAATWGEFRHGSDRDSRNLVMVTVGTGVGGGAVVHGVLVEGTQGFGGEVGHMIVARDGWRCTCGNRGCLEAYASGDALVRHARGLLADGGSSVLDDRGQFVPADVTAAAKDGDELAIAAIGRLGSWLGVGLASLVSLLDPDLVLVGGGVTDHIGQWLLPATAEAMTNQMFAADYREPPPVRMAALGDTAGMIGAAELARDHAATARG